jgi:hypothetical protein
MTKIHRIASTALLLLTLAWAHQDAGANQAKVLPVARSGTGALGCSGGASCHGDSGQDSGMTLTLTGPTTLKPGTVGHLHV